MNQYLKALRLEYPDEFDEVSDQDLALGIIKRRPDLAEKLKDVAYPENVSAPAQPTYWENQWNALNQGISKGVDTVNKGILTPFNEGAKELIDGSWYEKPLGALKLAGAPFEAISSMITAPIRQAGYNDSYAQAALNLLQMGEGLYSAGKAYGARPVGVGKNPNIDPYESLALPASGEASPSQSGRVWEAGPASVVREHTVPALEVSEIPAARGTQDLLAAAAESQRVPDVVEVPTFKGLLGYVRNGKVGEVKEFYNWTQQQLDEALRTTKYVAVKVEPSGTIKTKTIRTKPPEVAGLEETKLPRYTETPTAPADKTRLLQEAELLAQGDISDFGEVGRRATAARVRGYEGEPLPEAAGQRVVEPGEATIYTRTTEPAVGLKSGEPDPIVTKGWRKSPEVRAAERAAAAKAEAEVQTSTRPGVVVAEKPDPALLDLGPNRLAGKLREHLPWTQRLRAYDLLPDVVGVMRRHWDAGVRNFGGIYQNGVLRYRQFLNQENKRVGNTLANLSTDDDAALGRMLERNVTPEELASVRSTNPEIAGAYDKLRNAFERYADMAGIAKERVIKNYFPHLFKSDETLNRLHLEKSALEAKGVLTRQEESKLDQVTNLIRKLETFHDRIPKNIRTFFTEERLGAEGYQESARTAWEAYVRALGKKLYYQPIIDNLTWTGDPKTNEFVRSVVGRLFEHPNGGTLANIDRTVRNGLFYSKLKFNPRWSLVNFPSGQFAAMAELGQDYAQGIKWLSNKDGLNFYRRSPHFDSGFLEDLNGRLLSPKMDNATNLWSEQIEHMNRGVTYMGSLWKNFGSKVGAKAFEEALSANKVPQGALWAADDAVRVTQGQFGKEFNPPWLQLPGMKTLTQFMSVPAKLAQWMIANPKKGVAYALMTEAFQEALLATTDVDFSYTMGVGIDAADLYKDLVKLQQGKSELTFNEIMYKDVAKPWADGRGGIFSFGFGPVVSGAQAAGKMIAHPNDAGSIALKELVAPSRVARAYKAHGEGAPWTETAGIVAGLATRETSTRDKIFRELDQGNYKVARAIWNAYNVEHPDNPIDIDPEVFMQKQVEGRQAQAQKRNATRQRRYSTPAWMETVGPAVRGALGR